MALGINTNVASLTAQNQLNSSQKMNDQALERLSSGLRINSAKDDAAGLAISTRFSAQISGLNVAQRNANDGISYAQTAEGALGEITNALSRIRDLAVQSANATNSSSDRAALDQEVTALKDEVERIAQSTQFNGQNILNGNLSELSFQVGANAGQTISVDGVDSRTNKLGASVLEGQAIQDFAGLTLNASDLEIEGEAVDLSSATSVDQVVEAINKITDKTNVTAVRDQEVSQTFGTVTGTTAAVQISINGETIDLADGLDREGIATAINEAGVGVTAEVDGANGLKLSSQSDNFTLTDVDAGAGTTVFGETDGAQTRFDAGFTLTSDVSNTDFGITAANDSANLLNAGGTVEVSKVSTLSVASATDASSAITTVDYALDQINSLRAELGAVQNRFDSTISNLASTSENLSAANSRILDADFAAETAKLSKSQVLQQAGISVLAQANARPQQVLSLLQ